MSTETWDVTSLRQRISESEWQARIKLAQAYHLAARLRWTDHIYTHFSLRVPGDQPHFLINAFGQTFDEIQPETLVKIDIDGNIIDGPTGLEINLAGSRRAAAHRCRSRRSQHTDPAQSRPADQRRQH